MNVRSGIFHKFADIKLAHLSSDSKDIIEHKLANCRSTASFAWGEPIYQ